MVAPADRHDELVAHSASERARLGEGQVMRIGWHTAAHKARLPQHEFPVVLIAQTNRLTQSMDHVLARLRFGPPRSFMAGTDIRPADGHCTLLSESMRPPGRGKKTIRCPTEGRSLRGPVAIAHGGEPRLKPLLDHFGVCPGMCRCAQRAASSAEFTAAICDTFSRNESHPFCNVVRNIGGSLADRQGHPVADAIPHMLISFMHRMAISSLRHSHQLKQVTVRVLKVNASAAIPVIELAVIEAPRCAAV
jgi:hypothetical protein